LNRYFITSGQARLSSREAIPAKTVAVHLSPARTRRIRGFVASVDASEGAAGGRLAVVTAVYSNAN
jgi:hypothetical protein